jgi:molybdopterin-synthase adenylyltransferase
MTTSVAMTQEVDESLRAHLLRRDRQEDVCFAVWRPSTGRSRFTAIITKPILPSDGDRHIHGNASFEARFFLRAAAEAAQIGGGVALLHSHPGGHGWQGLSTDDADAERGHAAQAQALTGFPLVGLTLAGDGAWSARVWRADATGAERDPASTVRVVGPRLAVTYDDALIPEPAFDDRVRRTISAWGRASQMSLARLHVGIVGAGSVGSMVGEALARTGIGHISIFDFDSIEEHNLDRCLHATRADIGVAKAKVLADALGATSTSPTPDVIAYELSVAEDEGLLAALDCDVLFSCVDRPWPRAVLNLAAHAHLIPVIDGGILVEASPDGLHNAQWRAHIAAPGRRCLECLRQYDPGLVQVERDGLLDQTRYIEQLPANHEVRANENVFAFSMHTAALEVFQFLRMVIAPAGVADIGAERFHFVTGSVTRDTLDCDPGCWYRERLTSMGDQVGFRVTGRHRVAERARDQRRRLR